MAFAPLHEYLPALARRERRAITVGDAGPAGLPADQYDLVEFYCDDPDCDCRRVLLAVTSQAHPRVEAAIVFAWEPPEFYAGRVCEGLPATAAATAGPVLLDMPAGEQRAVLYDRARELVFGDPEQVARLRRHYAAFRRELLRRGKRAPGVRPDDRCPCGSGRKHKNCCGSAPAGNRLQVAVQEPAEQSVLREVDYIVGRARERTVHVVRFGALVFFSTHTGDAWLLDQEDATALPLARDGDRLGVRIVETETTIAIEWTHDFEIDGEAFVVRERGSGKVRRIVGYGRQLLEQVRSGRR